MPTQLTRRDFVRDLGLSAAALPFVWNLPSCQSGRRAARKQRLVIMFSPNGIVPNAFWPDETGDRFALKPILQPLEPFQDRLLVLRGVLNKVRGDGDSHMRGMSCLLTGIELFPGNIQGGSHTPAGWASGISIDQEIRNFLQSRPETRTRFGSLEFGVTVPDRADPWTRMVYAGANKPVAPIDNPYQMLAKMYGRVQDRESLTSILDNVQDDLRKVRAAVEQGGPAVAGGTRNVRPPDGKGIAGEQRQPRAAAAAAAGGRSQETPTTTCRNSAACRSTCW